MARSRAYVSSRSRTSNRGRSSLTRIPVGTQQEADQRIELPPRQRASTARARSQHRARTHVWRVALLPRGKRATARKTWELIDLKLGAFVRGQLLLMLLVGTVLSLAFWAIGLPYWLLVGAVAVAASGVVFGGLAVLLAVPVAAVLVTLLDVVVLKKDPGTEDVPSVIFPAKDAQA
jgi:hypothetical protein